MADRSKELHVAVLAFPFGTHAAPLLTLVRRLAAAEPAFKFSFLSSASSNRTIFSGSKAGDLGNITPFNVWDGVPEGHELSGNIHEGVQFFLRATPGNFWAAVEEAETASGSKVGCLLSDAFLWFACDMATEMKVPWMPYWTAGSCSLSVHLNTDLIRSSQLGKSGHQIEKQVQRAFEEAGPILAQQLRPKLKPSSASPLPGASKNGDGALEFIPGLSSVRPDDIPDGILTGKLDSPMAELLHNMAKHLPRATAVALNSFEELETAIAADLKSKLQKALCIGPSTLSSPALSKSDENGCLSWLDKHEAAFVAYISFGTITTPPPNELLALAETLRSSKIPFLWSLRDHSRGLLPEGFVEETESYGKMVTWAPQQEVLAHPSVGLFVTHCGWNSILESIAGGVPMICRPFFGDQQLNGRMVQDEWRIGVMVEGGIFTKAETIRALELVLSGEEGKKMREKIWVLKQNALEAVGPNGSSTTKFSTLVELIRSCKS
ncbi:flavonol 3-O-glucosyltransferase F3GT2-like isoform X1 [Diospyros lotus]|uniref:flavonol 3-O-glucosyltransferase F3GT2-like isoform X1 n=1 Tax=Diospyros lotus TaxID=55363 RepID=UPI002254D1AD|nr:flavonol 3-O-glucosyltransferase F3GT2-like isoform X1 [Diospyros lotus]